MLPSDLPPLLRGIRRDAVGTPMPMPSRSLRVPIGTEKKVEALMKRLCCNQSDLLRLVLRVGLEQIEEALDEQDRADEERIEPCREVVIHD